MTRADDRHAPTTVARARARRLAARVTAAALLGTAMLSAREAAPPFVPTFANEFADPFILRVGDTFYGYATNASGHRANLPMATSADLRHWNLLRDPDGKVHDALPVLPTWAKVGWTWAPTVLRVGDRFVAYFTAREAASDLQCVGVAVGDDPRGPFVSAAPEPLVCQRDLGGTIDASPFRDADGAAFLYFKNDGNNPRVLKPARIYAQRLSADGLHVEGSPAPLIANDQHWEWRVVEAPAMTRNAAGTYTLFFSGNHFGWESDQLRSNYAIGFARCATPLGPCVKAAENPVLHSYYTRHEGCLSGPGHESVLDAGGRQFLAFHAWSATNMCRPADGGRYLYIAPLSWNGDTPVIGPSLR